MSLMLDAHADPQHLRGALCKVASVSDLPASCRQQLVPHLVDVVRLIERQELPERPRLRAGGALRQAVDVAQRVALHGHVLQHAPRLRHRHRRRLSQKQTHSLMSAWKPARLCLGRLCDRRCSRERHTSRDVAQSTVKSL